MNEPTANQVPTPRIIPARRRFAHIIAQLKKGDIWLLPDQQRGVYVSSWRSIDYGHKVRFEVSYPDERTRLSVTYAVWPIASVHGPGMRITATSQHDHDDRWHYAVHDPHNDEQVALFVGEQPDSPVPGALLTSENFDRLLLSLIGAYAVARPL